LGGGGGERRGRGEGVNVGVCVRGGGAASMCQCRESTTVPHPMTVPHHITVMGDGYTDTPIAPDYISHRSRSHDLLLCEM